MNTRTLKPIIFAILVGLGGTACAAAAPAQTPLPQPTPQIIIKTVEVPGPQPTPIVVETTTTTTTYVTPEACMIAIGGLQTVVGKENDIIKRYLKGKEPTIKQWKALTDQDVDLILRAMDECAASHDGSS